MTSREFNGLLKRVHNGDKNAFEAIYNEYRNKMLYYALKTVKRIEDAQDVVSEVMYKLFKYA